MKSYTFEGVVTALTSISHIGETQGINAMLRREKVIQPDGSVEEVPMISGNAMRGLLRDRGMLHMLRTLGYGVNEETGEVAGLSLAAFYFLFSGGALSKLAGKGIDIDEARRWREMIPLVALFGGAMGNQIMPGKMRIGKLIPICRETWHIIPQRFAEEEPESIWDYCQQEAYTRSDDEKDENLRELISPKVRGFLEASAAEKRERSGTRDDVVGETGQSQQMRYFVETLAAGSRLLWDIVLEDVTEIEFDAFCVTLAEFGRYPYIGGKSGVGHGKVEVKFDKWHEINPRLSQVGNAVDVTLGTKYLQHIRDHADRIREIINGLE